MTLQLYATVTGALQGAFKGEATSPKLLHKIPGVAFSYGVLDPHDAATGAPSGRRQHQPVTFTKQWGASSPQFYQAAYTNEVLTTVLFEFFLPLSDGTESLDHTIKLTNATEEFVILLHVSSFANTSTPRPYTPLTNGLSSNSPMIGATSDDPQLGGGLIRSRSAQPSGAKPISPLPTREMPHSASPQQTFRIPPISHQPKTTAEAGLDVVSIRLPVRTARTVE